MRISISSLKMASITLATFYYSVALYFPAMAQVQNQGNINIEWRATADQADEAIQSLNFKGKISTETRQVDSKAFPILVILVGAVAIENLATTLVNIYRESQTGVIVSKLPNGGIKVTPDKNLPKGCVIYTDEKTVKPCIFNEKTPQNDPTALILGLLRGK